MSQRLEGPASEPDPEPPAGAPRPFALAVAAALALALGIASAVLTFRGLDHPAAFGHAQVARNLARGAGLTTQQTLPYEYRLFAEVPHASLYHRPAPAIALAPFFLVAGPREGLAIVPGVIAYALTALMVVALGHGLATPLAGWLAALLFLLHGPSLGYATSGLTEPLAAAALTAVVLVLARTPRTGGPWPALVAGAIAGLALTSLGSLRAVVPFVFVWALVWGRSFGVGRLLLAIAGFAIAALPELARVRAATGDPFAGHERYLLLADIPPFFDLNWFRTMTAIDPIGTVVASPGELQSKLIVHGRQLRELLPLALNPVLLGGAMLACFAWSPPPLRLTARVVMLLLVAQLLLHAALRVELPELAVFAAPAAAVTAALIATLVRSHPRLGALALLAAVAGFLAFGGAAMLDQFRSRPGRGAAIGAERELAAWVRERTRPADLVISDASEMLAWRADRRTVWLPLTFGLVERIPRREGERQFLVLTSAGAPDTASHWGRFLKPRAEIPGFARIETWSRGRLEAGIFLRQEFAGTPEETDTTRRTIGEASAPGGPR